MIPRNSVLGRQIIRKMEHIDSLLHMIWVGDGRVRSDKYARYQHAQYNLGRMLQ